MNKKFFKFHQQIVIFKEKGKTKKLILRCTLVTVRKKGKKGIKYYPETV